MSAHTLPQITHYIVHLYVSSAALPYVALLYNDSINGVL